jgi:hypothetical protein
MSDKISGLCYKTSDKIIDILDGLGYSSERKPSYENELRDLVAIEVRRNINEVGVMFYNNVAMVPIENSKCCGGFEGACSCSGERNNNEETNSKTENQ